MRGRQVEGTTMHSEDEKIQVASQFVDRYVNQTCGIYSFHFQIVWAAERDINTITPVTFMNVIAASGFLYSCSRFQGGRIPGFSPTGAAEVSGR